jgi:DNA-binding NarL/FixJ family response regulator
VKTENTAPARILIADDSPRIREFLKQFLTGHTAEWTVCAEAVNGLDAVEKAVECKPDLIILDLEMPVMDGMTAATKLAELLPRVPVVMFTLHKSAFVNLEARRAGVREVISKAEASMLFQAIEKLVPERSAPDARPNKETIFDPSPLPSTKTKANGGA